MFLMVFNKEMNTLQQTYPSTCLEGSRGNNELKQQFKMFSPRCLVSSATESRGYFTRLLKLTKNINPSYVSAREYAIKCIVRHCFSRFTIMTL